MEPITIKELYRHARRSHMAAQMGATPRRHGVSGRMFANHSESMMERPALRGLACVYNDVFYNGDELTAFLPGCFTAGLEAGNPVDLRMEHDAATVLGSTETGLRFVDAADALAFEYEPPSGQTGAVVISLVASRSRTDVSVGVVDIESAVQTIQGYKVRLISRANLVEVSLCKDGAVKKSHACVIDLATAPTLEDTAAHGTLRVTGLSNDLVTASKRLLDAATALRAPTAPRTYSVHHIWESK